MGKNEIGKIGKDKESGKDNNSGKAGAPDTFDELSHSLKEDDFDDDVNEMLRAEILEMGKCSKKPLEGICTVTEAVRNEMIEHFGVFLLAAKNLQRRLATSN
ncbi:hypothetical protein AVEN_217995-1 [Araneus ventricosus]|uniref:Uncharacterized protein n=1 Tax=Araneus ventricosus TaxID=182803 RepID=A0A4Y2DVH2_ARAVE|nr:hypothetical protein AVEN_217995-1 [Araneus ventricosus]